jgi:hypothetical protein
VTESKKLIESRAQCTVLAKLAQERHKEGNLAHLQAERCVNAICDKSEKRLNLAPQQAERDVNAICVKSEKRLNLAAKQAERDKNAIRDKSEKTLNLDACMIAAAKTFSDNALAEAHTKLIAEQVYLSAKAMTMVAITGKHYAIELLLQQRECDIAVNEMKHTLQSTLKRNDKKTSAVLEKQSAKSRVTIKGYKMDYVKSKHINKRNLKNPENVVSEYAAKICTLKEKVAAFDATLVQLKIFYDNAMIDLTTTHQSRVHSIHSRHFSSLLAEKQKLRGTYRIPFPMRFWMHIRMQEFHASQSTCPIIYCLND